LSQNLVDELLLYVAPVLLGRDARPLVNMPLITSMSERVEMQLLEVLQLGSDVRLHYRLNREM
ncbi:MAG TPA: dihydrofolate reductase family protein, partial [Steroidobacteraceae bacterium]|nr:dihydrofolate reductase family protein [Steroidobacteraceae bacterium]